MHKVEITLQLLLEFRGMPDPKTTRVQPEMPVISALISCQASKLTYFSKFTSIIACYFGSTAQYVWV